MKTPSLKALVGVGFIVLLINSGYIAAFAHPTVFYMGNVLAHLVIGVLLSILFFTLLKRDADVRRDAGPSGLFFAIALGVGLWLTYYGNIREHSWALRTHIIAAAIGVAALLPYAMRLARGTAARDFVSRIRSGGEDPSLVQDGQPSGASRQFGMALQAAAVFALVFPLAAIEYQRRNPPSTHRIVNPNSPPLTMQGEGGGPKSPFFPSSAKTNVGGIIPSNFFMDSKACGECHKEIYEQWDRSMHHFASFNNQFYRKSIEYMQSVVGPQPSKWCAGCHDHAVFFNGRFEKPIKDQIDTPEAHAGLACTSCHSITHVDSSMGNGGFTIEYPPLHELMTSRNPVIRRIDRFMTYLNPEPHRRSFMKPFMKQNSAEYCASCHKVHLDVPVNEYRWFRGFNDYDNWQASAMSGQGARSFYYPPKVSTCVDCHMTPVKSTDPGRHADGTVHSHSFATANTAVPFVNNDAKQMKDTEDFLKSGFISVDIFSVAPIDEKREGTRMIRRAGDGPQAMSGSSVGEEAEQSGPVFIREVGEVAAPIDKAAPPLPPGSSARVDVVVRTRKIGHFFPGGTLDSFDIWVELQGKDADGRTVFWSGQITDEGKGPVEEGAHFYRAYQLDGQGNPINKRNAWQARSVLYVRSIQPGAADTVHYRIKIPKDARGPITLSAKLQYRKFSWFYTNFAYAGVPKSPHLIDKNGDGSEWSMDVANVPKNVSGKLKGEVPSLPTITLAEATAKLPVGAPGSTPQWTQVATKADRERWNDWGIGLLLQGDLKGAEYAFKKVTEAEPEYADGWLNVARALIQEGETEAAKPYIAQALQRDGTLARIYYFKALIEKADGDYPAALKSLGKVYEKYPRDRVALNQQARILFLQREYQKSVDMTKQVFGVDPEDVQGHYTAMLAYRGLGNEAEAEREQKLFMRFKAEESAQSITGKRRLLKPEENNERQQIHEHESIPLGVPVPSKAVLTDAKPAPAPTTRVGGGGK